MIQRDIIFSYRKDALLQVIPYFTVKRCPEDFPSRPLEISHHPYFIDYKVPEISNKKGVIAANYSSDKKPNFKDYSLEEVEGQLAQTDETAKRYREILTLINTLSHEYFFHYNQRQGWFTTLGDKHEMHYGQTFYKSPEYERQPKEIKKVPWYAIADPGYFYITISKNQRLVINLEALIKAYFTCKDDTFKQEYLNAALVLGKSFRIREIDHSASYLMMVSAIEALIQIEYRNQKTDHCDDCGQPVYSISKKFKKFLVDYGFEVDNAVKNKFYTMRSKITHNGALLGMSYDSKLVIENQEDLDQDYQRFIDRLYYERFEELAKTCFRYFLIKKTGYLESLIEQHKPKE